MSVAAHNPQSTPFEREALLESLTAGQLRDVVAAAKMSPSSIAGARTKEGLVNLVKGSNQLHTWSIVHRLEALSPFKHVFLFGWNPERGSEGYLEVVRAVRSYHEKAFASFVPLDPTSDEFQFQLGLVDENRSRLILKFVHTVDSVEFVDEGNDLFKKVRSKKRHPIVLVLRLLERFATISFPGYTQGLALRADERLSYHDLVSRFVAYIAGDAFGLHVEDVPVKSPIEYLLENRPEEVFNIGRNMQQAGGDLSVNAADERSDVVAALMGLFPSLTAHEVKESLRNNDSSGMLLLWKRLGVLTRINLREKSTDILFIWKKGGASSTATDHILAQLHDGIRAAGQPQLQEAARAIKEMPVGQLIRSSTLIQRFSLKQVDSARLLMNALREGILEMRFRVRSDGPLTDFDNSWKTSLDQLPPAATNEQGDTVDLADPANIDVAYERVTRS